MSKSETATYTHGHHASVLRSHSWRTAANSAAYLLPHIQPHMRILDVGCGPGTITMDLARLVPEGHVTGLERDAAGVLDQARAQAAAQHLDNISFVAGDGNALAFADGSFDLVLCHQVLQHVRDPVGVLAEMRRVAKTGGLVAARESDYGGFVWWPEVGGQGQTQGQAQAQGQGQAQLGLEGWRACYTRVTRANGGEPNAGRMVHAWARRAGFAADAITCSSSNWCYATKAEVEWWSGLWAERTVASAFAATAKENAGVGEAELEEIAAAWRRWGSEEDAWFSVVSGEVICVKR
ncbi:putative ubiE/COQ5 methyltransferase [Aspergillus clavatus NRRL 1]|uniref:UbiE/COQ5 methyltransferase, putative n=1 Tax=Aspergillus clavatus (strain ATCC 1007 / CBS 513.65 / DSM 816 / NCTC 3887 / NRRL 1 / QM 1276 / 107) TaxID=344612 RepID=A1CDU1_ASPCL|nr:ubiE/COQ5 methyltransferase, putative [Aspergillus clavatus NRRL 1]EAW12018.1 ubiE/COQ5 methyltransferase, putative [Aspergillus clavatus NRRL 1]